MPDSSLDQLPLLFDADHGSARDGHWPVRVSARARRMSVRVFHSGRVEIVAPTRASAKTIEQFVARHRSWIERKQSAAIVQRPVEPFPPSQVELTASAEKWRISLEPNHSHPRLEQTPDGVLRLRGRDLGEESVRSLLRSWVICRAREFLPAQLATCAKAVDIRYERAVIRCQRTRWGSCSRRGTISLNACTMFQRPEVMRYLLVHELAHLIHMNHSKRFWRFVERHVPDYRELDGELRAGWRRVPHWFNAGIAAS